MAKVLQKQRKGMVWRGLDKSGLEKGQVADCRDTVINILIPQCGGMALPAELSVSYGLCPKELISDRT